MAKRKYEVLYGFEDESLDKKIVSVQVSDVRYQFWTPKADYRTLFSRKETQSFFVALLD